MTNNLGDITINISAKSTVEHRKDRIRIDLFPMCTSLIVEKKDLEIHE
jgi:hypothetical protein